MQSFLYVVLTGILTTEAIDVHGSGYLLPSMCDYKLVAVILGSNSVQKPVLLYKSYQLLFLLICELYTGTLGLA